VENALGGATVLGGVVEDAVVEAVAFEQGRLDDVSVGGEGGAVVESSRPTSADRCSGDR